MAVKRPVRAPTSFIPRSAVLVVGLLALITTIGVAGPKRPSADLSPEQPSARASASSVRVGPPSIRYLPTAAPTIAPGALFVGDILSAEWSPTGSQFSVACAEPQRFIYVLDRAGHGVDRIRADDFRWLGAGAYVSVVRPSDGNSLDRRTFVGLIGSDGQEELPGAVAIAATGSGERIALASLDPNRPGDSFYVWSPETLLGLQSGLPVEFSPDGSLLAVAVGPAGWSDRNAKGTVMGSIEVRDADTGRVVARAGDVMLPMNVGVRFSPDGKYLAFEKTPQGGAAAGKIGLLDIANGRFWTSPAPSIVRLAWIDASHLRIWSSTVGSTMPATTPIQIEFVAYRPDTSTTTGTDLSIRGWTATWDDRASVVTVDKNGTAARLSFGGPIRSAIWSPEGSDLLVVWGSAPPFSDSSGGYGGGAEFVSIVRP